MPDLDHIKATINKMGVYYDSDDDYMEAWNNLVGYFDALIQIDLKQKSKLDTPE